MCLLDAAPHLVGHLGSEPDHVKGIKDSDPVGQTVVNGVRIGTKWVECSGLHTVVEPIGLGLEPGFVDVS
jgi:hypothetical protein